MANGSKQLNEQKSCIYNRKQITWQYKRRAQQRKQLVNLVLREQWTRSETHLYGDRIHFSVLILGLRAMVMALFMENSGILNLETV